MIGLLGWNALQSFAVAFACDRTCAWIRIARWRPGCEVRVVHAPLLSAARAWVRHVGPACSARLCLQGCEVVLDAPKPCVRSCRIAPQFRFRGGASDPPKNASGLEKKGEGPVRTLDRLPTYCTRAALLSALSALLLLLLPLKPPSHSYL